MADTQGAPQDEALRLYAEVQRSFSRKGSAQIEPIKYDHSVIDAHRPPMAKGWNTVAPQATVPLYSPALDRRPTNTSLLHNVRPGWEHKHGEELDDSSSSSEDDDAVGEEHKRRHVPGRKHRHRGQRGQYSRFNIGNDGNRSSGRVSKRDGRLNINLNETSNRGVMAKALGAGFLQKLSPKAPGQDYDRAEELQSSGASSRSDGSTRIPRPKLNIVVMVIGSRGDIQPFLKLGKILKGEGHRVRIATHPAFRDFVQKDSGLEFFSVGGDPAELMAFMVKNPGMIPTMETLKKGEVGRRRDQMAEMFEGFWRACVNATDEEKDVTNLKMMGAKAPFVADAIIANPPCFAHIHCAERLGVPLHLMFTFPYTPTQAFPHPLANIRRTNVDPGYANFMSYPLVEMMTWQGLGDLINNFRVHTLGLEPVSTLWAPGQLYRLKVPYTYLWSPGLIPKPPDWGPEIDIAGFVFLDLASSFKPPEELVDFLDAGETPIYIGFGSIVVDDADKFTKMIFEAVAKAGVRALVSKGWGGLGDDDNTPDNIFMLENTPHDWLFPKVQAVVHHGGAGTTAIGLKCGKPTMIVPFFGDQQFWGSMIGTAGAGPEPVPYKQLDSEKLAAGIKQCLTDEARAAAKKIAESIELEGDGAKNAVESFHRSLVLRGQHSMRCSILEDRVAVWAMKKTNLRLSALAAELLVEKKKLSWKELRLIRHKEWNDFEGPGEPVSGGATALTRLATRMATGVGRVPFRIAKTKRRRTEHEERKRKHEKYEARKSADQRRSQDHSGNVSVRGGANESAIDGQTSEVRVNQVVDKTIAQDEADAEKNHADATSATHLDRATSGPELTKKTTAGEPLSGLSQAKEEEDHQDDSESVVSDVSDDPSDGAAEEIAKDIGSGLGHTGEALVLFPMDLFLAIAQGFHNAPRLYGDPTVRRPPRITGIKSGLKAAGQEFVYGIYDGCTGVFTQPYTGARNDGALGLIKGVGMGLTGFVLKDISAFIGPVGYTLKGLHKEVLKSQQPTAFIRKARIMQGRRDMTLLSENVKDKQRVEQEVSHGWAVILEVWGIMEEKKTEGLMGRMRVLRQRRQWRANGAFENVVMAEMAVEATRRGEGLEETFAEQRKELEKVDRPRKNVVGELQNRKKKRMEEKGAKKSAKKGAEKGAKKEGEQSDGVASGQVKESRSSA